MSFYLKKKSGIFSDIIQKLSPSNLHFCFSIFGKTKVWHICYSLYLWKFCVVFVSPACSSFSFFFFCLEGRLCFQLTELYVPSLELHFTQHPETPQKITMINQWRLEKWKHNHLSVVSFLWCNTYTSELEIYEFES